MKHLQKFSIFESRLNLSSSQIEFLERHLRKHSSLHLPGEWRVNPTTGLVDLEGDFSCKGLGIKDFMGIRFGRVNGNFNCSGNLLESLEGAPREVLNFFCERNPKIRSLAGGPVKADIYGCEECSLDSLDGSPEDVRLFSCRNNVLRTLEGGPKKVVSFWCKDNPLISLEGAPEELENFEGPGIVHLGQKIEPFFETALKIYYSLDDDPWSRSITERGKDLLATLVGQKALQRKIDQDPEKMLVKLKEVLKNPKFKHLRWPSHLRKERDLLSDLSDIGL